MQGFDLLSYITGNSMLEGSPKTTAHKSIPDGSLESFGNYARKTRRDITYHNLNGTEIPSIVKANLAGTIGSSVNIQARTSSEKINEQFEELLNQHNSNENFATCGRFDRNEGFRLAEIGRASCRERVCMFV